MAAERSRVVGCTSWLWGGGGGGGAAHLEEEAEAWYAEGREGGRLAAKLDRDKGSKAVGGEHVSKSSSSALVYSLGP